MNVSTYRRRTLSSVLVLGGLLLPLLIPDAMASSVVPLDLDGLSARAERVVVGHVEKTDSHFLASGSQRIVTDVTLVVERPVVGDPSATRFVVRHLGGEVGKLGQLVSGEASYFVGERLVLFAAQRQGAYFAVGMAQGVLPIHDDAAGVAYVTSPRRKIEGGRIASEVRTVDDLVDEVSASVTRRLTR